MIPRILHAVQISPTGWRITLEWNGKRYTMVYGEQGREIVAVHAA